MAAERRAAPVATVATNVAETVRHPARQVRLLQLLRAIEVVPVTHDLAAAVGVLLREATSSAVVDALAVAVAHRRGAAVLTGDPDDLRPLAAVLGVRVVVL